jgi:hypothetical protein
VLLTTIKVRPAPERRTAFARWATAQTPQVATCSHSEFAVPPDLFTHMPEDLLVGSLVDGHRYISPDEDAAATVTTAAGGEDSDRAPDFAPLDDVPADDEGQEQDDAPPEYDCGLCPRSFPTERGRNTHRRQAHPEGGS